MLGVSWYTSSVGKKTLMAVSGLLLLGFVIAHLLGNLTVFLGPDALNAYAKKLQSLGPGLWVARIGLLAIAVVHIWLSIVLSLENRKARPVAYALKRNIETTWAARTMMVSGVLVLVYIVYHLLHFTFGVTHPEIMHLKDPVGRHDVYAMVVLGFQQRPVAVAYIAAMGLLCLHLSHGIGSAPQTLGINNDRTLRLFQRAGQVLAVAIFLGYSLIPLAIQLGWVDLTRTLP